VQLLGSSPLAVVKESREIEGVEQDVIVLRLEQPDAGATTLVGTELSVLEEFSGPCAGRPESGTCESPPHEFINTVGPDCDGVIKLKFLGCASPAAILSECGIVLDCELGLTEACVPPHIPDDTGRLPGEYTPYIIPSPQVDPPGSDDDDDETPVTSPATLPYSDCFDTVNELNRLGYVTPLDDFTAVSGGWLLVPDDTDCPLDSMCSLSCSEGETCLDWEVTAANSYSTEETISLSMKNLSVLDFGDNSTANRIVRTDVKLMYGSASALRNAGVVINYRDHTSLSGRKVYYYAELDYDNQEFSLKYFNGTFTSDVVVHNMLGQLNLETWYRIDIRTEAPSAQSSSSGRVDVTVKLTDPCGAMSVQIGPIPTSQYLPSSGLFGFGTRRAHSRFSYIRIDEN